VKKDLKNGQFSFEIAYELTHYTVRLSESKNYRFYLEPKDKVLKLPKVEFETKTPEERARWYKALTNPSSVIQQ
jgi:hypothetical protein